MSLYEFIADIQESIAMEELFPGKKDVPTFLALLVLQSLSCGKTGYYFSWQSAKLKKCGTSNFNMGVNGKSLKCAIENG